jgi:signal transduction histidine kinase
MKHLWINLLDDAIKFTPDRGKLHVSLGGERIPSPFP